jgi:hypothetical protein
MRRGAGEGGAMSARAIANDRLFHPLAVGSELAGCRVVKARPDAFRVAEMWYVVRFLCCGTERRLSHKALMMRHSHGCTVCVVCRNRSRSRYAPEIRETATAMRARGQSTAKISRALGVPDWTVRGWLL